MPDNEALGKYITTFFPQGNAVWREAVNIDWMISQQALLRMLQKVCNATERWIVDTVRTCYTSTHATYSINKNDDSFLDLHTVEFPLTSFRFVGKPENNYQLRELLVQYEQWIDTWNEQLSSLFTWFPFPNETVPVSLVLAPPVPTSALALEPDPIQSEISTTSLPGKDAPLPTTTKEIATDKDTLCSGELSTSVGEEDELKA